MNNRICRRIDIFTAYQRKGLLTFYGKCILHKSRIPQTMVQDIHKEKTVLIKQIILSYLLSMSFSLCPLVSFIEDPGNFSHFSGFGH